MLTIALLPLVLMACASKAPIATEPSLGHTNEPPITWSMGNAGQQGTQAAYLHQTHPGELFGRAHREWGHGHIDCLRAGAVRAQENIDLSWCSQLRIDTNGRWRVLGLDFVEGGERQLRACLIRAQESEPPARSLPDPVTAHSCVRAITHFSDEALQIWRDDPDAWMPQMIRDEPASGLVGEPLVGVPGWLGTGDLPGGAGPGRAERSATAILAVRDLREPLRECYGHYAAWVPPPPPLWAWFDLVWTTDNAHYVTTPLDAVDSISRFSNCVTVRLPQPPDGTATHVVRIEVEVQPEPH